MIWTSINKLGRRTLQLSLLSSLMLVAGCEGSQLGDNLSKATEPDPQLAEEAATAEGNSNSATDRTNGDASDSGSDTGTSETTGNREVAEEADDPNPNSTENEPKAETPPAVVAGEYRDIGKAPEELQPYLVDLIELALLEVRAPETPAPAPAASDTAKEGDAEQSTTTTAQPAAQSTSQPAPPAADEFRPNQAMIRREYARWLLATNNEFYAGEPKLKVRPGVNSAKPVFQDVPITDPDFAAIQGLAEAGIIPSPLTGSSTTITFRPNAPLTRADLLLWKVPLDTRQTLPAASISAVEQAWGFQDAGNIEPRTLQAVLTDYQNGDFSNIRRAFNYTTLFQPDKAATRAEGAAVLWRFGNPTKGITAAEIRNPGSNSDNNNTEGDAPTDG